MCASSCYPFISPSSKLQLPSPCSPSFLAATPSPEKSQISPPLSPTTTPRLKSSPPPHPTPPPPSTPPSPASVKMPSTLKYFTPNYAILVSFCEAASSGSDPLRRGLRPSAGTLRGQCRFEWADWAAGGGWILPTNI
ncbi:hypothetical protein RHMOL_Rhmol07G0301100 [Rhododendron molle]|uniref:Uncharacterized protein n=1 Tax=Rhododendron molle TaxID=49168 RepID=A0ACC0N7Z5_RHOML|nr:hypothetical protein RHMOL_Rhmol07G0301100 [Rhododendron molle]